MSATSSATDRVFDLQLDLLIGPRGEFTDDELERGWRLYGAELTENARTRSRPGWRPWGWWRYEAGREEPDHHEGVVYLAKRGELTDGEIAALAEDAAEAKARIGTPAEHILWPSGSANVKRVELHEAVQAVGPNQSLRRTR